MKIIHTSKKFLKILACATILLTAHQAKAQQVTVDASIDSLQLLIGEQAKIKLEVSMDANQKLTLPALRDTIVRGVEILDIAKPDTQMLNDGRRMPGCLKTVRPSSVRSVHTMRIIRTPIRMDMVPSYLVGQLLCNIWLKEINMRFGFRSS